MFEILSTILFWISEQAKYFYQKNFCSEVTDREAVYIKGGKLCLKSS